MCSVIGTAGHVDHGKSALIQALTGVHPSHLPQEFERGMTIDLGFACLRTEKGDEIGIIDVPGHERFLRNMLCSLWGLDLVLFVVAADEGWATLSQEHLRVINALGIRQILVAMNKCDLVDVDRLDQVEEDILEHFISECDFLPDIWRVSAKTGEGIKELRQGLIDSIQNLPPIMPLSEAPHLYIDRVFTINGTGTTITGTLRGSGIKIGDTLRLFPKDLLVKVKSIHSYHTPREQAQPGSRVAMSFRHLKRERVSRGDCLAKPEENISVSCEWIVLLQPGDGVFKKQCKLEVALGTSHAQAKCYLLGDSTLVRLQLSKPLPVFWGQKVLLMCPGGSHMAGAGNVVWTGPLASKQRPHLIRALQTSKGQDLKRLRSHIELAVNGYANVVMNEATPLDCHTLGDWWLTDCYRLRCLNHLNQSLSDPTSELTCEELSVRLNIPLPVIRVLVEEQVKERQWQQKEEGISLSGADFGYLSHDQKALLNEIHSAGRHCFSAIQNARPRLLQQLKVLMEKKYIIPMDEKLFIAREHYQEIIEILFSKYQQGNQFSISDFREITNLSRKQLIPLLNRMERDGWVKREGNVRRVIREFHNHS